MAKTKLRTDNIDLSGSTEALELPIGTTAQRQFSVEYLIVAGGGGGDMDERGGAGAGGVLSGTVDLDLHKTYTITVGAGGAKNGSGSANDSTSGENSVFYNFTAIGGANATFNTTTLRGVSGGSGAGATGHYSASCTPGTPGDGVQGQGYAGGAGYGRCSNDEAGGGGGGAGAKGGDASPNTGGAGGIGIISYIKDPTGTKYAGGGGGGGRTTGGTAVAGYGGSDGVAGTNASDATANTGGGGGSTGGNIGGVRGGDGGSGVVIIRYSSVYSGNVTLTGVSGTVDNAISGSTDLYAEITSGSGTIEFISGPNIETGTIRENTTTGNLEIYTGDQGWRAIKQIGQDVGLVPSNNFAVALYTGNGGAKSVDLGFQPGLTWIKGRDTNGKWNVWYDVQRGPTNMLSSNSEDAEATYGSVTPTSTGFAIGAASAGDLNSNGEKYVSWNWKASDSFSYPAVGSQIASAGYTNVAAGFSMVEYTGVLSSSGSYEVQHGLGGVPEIIISKEINRASTRWVVRTQMIDNNPYSYLIFYSPGDAALAQLNSSDGTLNLPTATKFDINWNTSVGTNGYDIIAYCFRSIPGYSLIGKYTGTGSATSSPKIYTGFEPAWLMTKPASTTGWWYIFDNKRSTSNPRDIILGANSSDAEYTSSNYNVNFYNDGFQYRNSTICCNDAGVEYLFMCFAS
tara:strand:- start:703 stop:2748 length:2046 start_codon:yes stop_codon:yes gene_type:complete